VTWNQRQALSDFSHKCFQLQCCGGCFDREQSRARCWDQADPRDSRSHHKRFSKSCPQLVVSFAATTTKKCSTRHVFFPFIDPIHSEVKLGKLISLSFNTFNIDTSHHGGLD
jgi:hypothetical protein